MNDYLRDLNNTEIISKIIDPDIKDGLPVLSVVIVTYNTNKDQLEQCLSSLNNQTFKEFEILLVDNNDQLDISDLVSKYTIKYIKLKRNYGVNIGRNVGINFSKGDIIVFLDDDAIPARNFVEAHFNAHNECNMLGLRGKSLPKTSSIYNHFASHYDLGEKVIPWLMDLEGNSSFKKETLIEAGGFNPELWGHEGIELSYRIISRYKDKSKLVYHPKPIIYHDYSDTFIKYAKKQLRHDRHRVMLNYYFPDLFKFASKYKLDSIKLKKDTPPLLVRVKLFAIFALTFLIVNVVRLKRLLFKWKPTY
ncbi:glycosyltransferase family 2 protein [Methanosarcina sp. 1.H.A.2.2]|uniref:glycosyltransferase family 2 protein n=1 Tax=Methanosarcina sp. 1.H.A.2.2 TaxID=1483601 RepID=UPI00062195A1|nr:glycosyltransferase [Methanosarcina sp. 1.H.A.2.2]KKH47434.1 hypothetical protein EO93_01280 [Methanosarcina sp. 1.H.A.2.2]